ncbi:hypothetical protein Q9L58_004007 [Maublancomyces gigas]|uniref:Uncharacterized protein n=1 Tax=Discina gigas TaxID=1032678 RepID=A0ABR3GM77_9PEZI
MLSRSTPPPTPDEPSAEPAQKITTRERKLESLRTANQALEGQIAEVQLDTDEGLKKLK